VLHIGRRADHDPAEGTRERQEPGDESRVTKRLRRLRFLAGFQPQSNLFISRSDWFRRTRRQVFVLLTPTSKWIYWLQSGRRARVAVAVISNGPTSRIPATARTTWGIL
jgi:hypothetical protein